MKKFLLSIGMMLFLVTTGFGQILTFENSALSGSEVSTTSSSNNSNISSSTLSRGAGINASNNGGRFNATSHSTEATLVSGDNSYFTFNINPNSGFSFSVTSIEFNFQRSGTGPKSFAIRSSNDSFASDLGTAVTISDVTTTQTLTFTFTLSDITSDTEFRLYTYNAESTSGSGGIGDGSGDDITVNGTTQSTGGTPNKFAITSVNGGNSATSGTGFDVIVELQDSGDSPTVATQDTAVTLTLATGTGSLGGTLTGTISTGNSNVTISGVTYDTAESGVSITATNTGGSLSSGTSSTFEVLSATTQLVLVSVPSDGFTNTALSSFTVEARRADNSVDLNYTSSVTVSKASGSGTIGGTTSKSASSGVATFDDITFDTAGDVTISATDGSLTSSASSTITIATVNTSPGIGDLYITEYSDGSSFSNEFIELYNASDDGVDVNGYVIRQLSSTQSYTFSGSTVIEAGGFLVLSRNADQSSFESEWGSLASNVTFVNSGNSLPQINGAETYLLENGSGVNVDPATDDEYTAQSISSSGKVYRNNMNGNTTADWTTGSRSEATPGQLDTGIEISGDAGWRLLSLPKSGGIVTDISDDTPVQGVTGGDNTGETSNFKLYQSGSSFADPTNVTTAWGDGFGFALYFFNNSTAGSSTLPVSLDATGGEPTSDVSVTLNTTASGSTAGSGASDSKYTLVGNPFATNYDLNSVTVTGDGIQNNVQFWNDGTSSYSAQDRTTPYIVSPWQGFWVEVTSANTTTAISFPTSGKSTSDTTGVFFSKEVNNRGDISFSLSSDESYDEAIRLSFRDYATLDFDIADASKLNPLAATYATMAFSSNDRLKAVESLPYNLEETVELKLEEQLVGVSGEFTLDWSGLETIPANWTLIFHDFDEGKSVDMREVSEYTFTAEADDKSKVNPLSILSGPTAQTMKSKSSGNTRFGITIQPNTAVSNEPGDTPLSFGLEQNYPNPFNPSTTINYTIAKSGQVSLSVYNLMGQKVAELVNEVKGEGSYNVSWNAAGAASGMYYYRLEAAGQTLTRKMTLIK